MKIGALYIPRTTTAASVWTKVGLVGPAIFLGWNFVGCEIKFDFLGSSEKPVSFWSTAGLSLANGPDNKARIRVMELFDEFFQEANLETEGLSLLWDGQ